MRHTFLFSCLFLVFTFGFKSGKAQDTLLMRNGNQVITKIIEISSSEIKYKRFDNLDGPTFVINKQEVMVIHYQNGTTETINTQNSNSGQSKTETMIVIQKKPEVVDPKIYPSGNGYYVDGHRISQRELQNKLMNSEDKEVIKHIKAAKVNKGLTAVGFVAIPCMVGGVITLLTETISYRNNPNTSPDYSATYGLFGGGVLCLVGSTVFRITSKGHVNKAVKLYNAKF